MYFAVGSAADVCKVAMIEVSHQLAQASPHSRLADLYYILGTWIT